MADVAPATTTQKPKAIRTRSGCFTCRHRKKKCDESRCAETGGCLRCKNSGYECLGYPKRKRIGSMDIRPNEREEFTTSLDATVGIASDNSITSPLSAHVLDDSVLQHRFSDPFSITSSNDSSCTIIGRCILLGHPICQKCLSSIQPMLSPSDVIPDFSIPTPFASAPQTNPSSPSTSRQEQVLHCLIGYYAAVMTCWVEGCHPRAIVQSTFFKDLVQYLFEHIDRDEGLRLSIACCASGYISGGQLSWPEDLKAIKEWTETLLNGAVELADVTTSSTLSSSRAFDDTGDRLARHSYIDRHLSRHARYLYRMANRNLEDALHQYAHSPNASVLQNDSAQSRSKGGSYMDLKRMQQYNNVILSAMSQAIFSWAELEVKSYYEDLDQAIQIVNTVMGGIRKVKMKDINRFDTLGFAVLIWADILAAIARGCQPYFYLDDEGLSSTSETIPHRYPFSFFNCPTSLLKALSSLARIQFECDVVPFIAGQRSKVLPDRLLRQAQEIEASLNTMASSTHPSSQYHGSPNCSEMTRLAAIILLYITIYDKGPLHPTIKYCLQSILNLWQYGAKAYCVDVGCTNYLFAIFQASSVAHEARDRVICEEAMNLVGHDEASADAGRRMIKEIWKRTDEGGMPIIWSDVVKEGKLLLAFL